MLAPSSSDIELELPCPHRGQLAVIKSQARHRAVRCGRRWGKTVTGILEATDTLVGGGVLTPPTGQGLPVGWFAPTYKIFLDAWEQLERVLTPLIVAKNTTDKRMKLITGGVLEGWSLDTDDPGRSRKYAKVIIDEAGMVPNLRDLWLQAIRPTLVDYRGRALFLGTPKVICPYFNELIELGESGTDPEWAAFRGKTIDNFHLPGVAEEVAKAREEMPEWMFRQEYEGEPAEGFNAFFKRSVITAHKRDHARKPLMRCTIDVDEELAQDREAVLRRAAGRLDHITVTEDSRGPWRLWCDLEPDDQGRMRPPQGRSYAMGVDIARGVGASNSVMSVIDAETGEKMAEYVWPGTTPDELALLAAAAGYWFGGLAGFAMICPELPGPGAEFVAKMIAIGYPGLYRERTGETTTKERVTPKYGWTNTEKSKEPMLGAYRAALASGRFINRSAEALDECLRFYYDEHMRLVCIDEEAMEDGPARSPHGDRVIADGLALLCSKMAPRVQPEKREAPVGSLAWMRKQADAKRQQRQRW